MSSHIDVLLINCPREITPSKGTCFQDKRMPLGLMYISSYLKAHGIVTRLLDAEAMSLGVSAILRIAEETAPRMIGLNCHTLNRHVVYEIVNALRVLLPNTLQILGGAHPALAPYTTFKECGEIDVIVESEGEQIMYDIARHPGEIAKIPGLYYREHGLVHYTGVRSRIQNLDELPFPDLEDLPLSTYLEYEDPSLPGLWRRAYLSASRGCRYKCSYCTEHPFWVGGTTFRSSESVAAEMARYRDRYGINRFYFYDDTLTDWPDLGRLCQAAAETGALWSCSTRIDHMTESLIREMVCGGCREIAFGLESGSEKSLRMMKKGWQAQRSREEVGEAIRMCVMSGIMPRAHFMIGFPWEDREDITETVKFAVWLKRYSLADANFFAVKVYPGTSFSQGVLRSSRTGESLPEERIYDAWSVYDWFKTKNPKVAAKLKRFNDIPMISMNPHLENISLRQLVRNAYEIFFSDCSVDEVEASLWQGVLWEKQAHFAEFQV